MDKSSVLTRRPIFLGLIVLAGSVFLTGISPLFPARAQAETLAKPAPAAADKVKTFSAKHLWDAKVEIGEVAELGESRYGVRRMIPITGGTFAGANIRGTVLAGGADFQLTRTDGDTELLASYMLKTQDGFIIQMTNRAFS